MPKVAPKITPEIIQTAAIKAPDGSVHTVPRPGRHVDVEAQLEAQKLPTTGTRGFVTSKQPFVSRQEAAKIATANGQAKNLRVPGMLHSEDAW